MAADFDLVRRHPAIENIIRSAAAARIATTTLLLFESLRFEETGRFVNFTADKIAPATFHFLVVSASSYKLSQQQQFKKRSSFMWR